ncbi:MAG: amidohydrolase family protein [Candidatus Brocadiia bacterium]
MTCIVDAHCHCGCQDPSPPQDYETVAALHRQAGVDAAWAFPPVLEVYDRHDPAFVDAPEWQARRRRAHDYLLGLSRQALVPRIVPFFFVWNDFDLAGLTAEFRGVKWHRHPDEPVYRYDDPRCRRFLDAVVARQLPVTLEETFENTLRFLDELAPDAVVVIPHCGVLNGGFERLHERRVWERPRVYADSSAAPSHQPGLLRTFLDAYGPEKLLYGSDYPFDTPVACRQAIADLALAPADEALVLGGNALRLVGESR